MKLHQWMSWLETHFVGGWQHKGRADFYLHRYEHTELGIQIVTDNTKDGKSSKVVIPGKALSTLCFKDQLRLLDQAYIQGFTLNRVDLCMDCFGVDVRIVESARDHAKDKRNIKLTHKTEQEFDRDKEGGLTVYLGSRSASRYWCLYDKGAQQGGENHRWQRVEGRFNKKRAGSIARMFNCNLDPTKDAEILVSMLLPDIWTKPLAWWDELRTVETPMMDSIETPDLNRYETWLRTQVFPKLRMIANELHVSASEIVNILMANDQFANTTHEGKNKNLIADFESKYVDELNTTRSNRCTTFAGDHEVEVTRMNDQMYV